MTERPGRRARWTVVAVLAPGTAAVFSAAMAWAGHATPTTVSTPAPAARPVVRTVSDDAAAVVATRALAHNRSEVAQLTRRLATLRHQTIQVRAAEARAAAAAAAASGGGGGSVGSVGSVSTQPLPPITVQGPPPVYVAPAPPPPPPVHTGTGASGAKP